MTEHLSPYRQNIIQSAPTIFSKVVGIYRFHVEVHGVGLCFHVSNRRLLEYLKIYFPKFWQKKSEDPFHIYWEAPESFTESQEEFDNVIDPDCYFFDEWVSQRDFLLQRLPGKRIHLIAKEEVSDGLFNFLRYLLPHELLKQNKILFHSSVVVDEAEEAYLFFGHSGAGKTTISQLCNQGNVLGDDMNLLMVEEDSVFVEPAVVGQRYFSKENFGSYYHLEKAFWLKKADFIKAEEMEEKRISHLLSSFTGLFWDQLSEEDYQKVFQLVKKIDKNLSLYNLEFNLDEKVWDYVRQLN